MLKRMVPMVVTASVAGPSLVHAQDDEATVGWSDVAEATFVMTAGNASSSTFGLKNTLQHAWENAVWKLDVGGVRTEATTVTRTVAGTTGNFRVSETESTELTAENYFVRSRYDRSLSPTTFVFGGAGWTRNTFSGFDSRLSVVAGTGRTWFEDEARRFKTDVGLTFTSQDDIVPDPTVDDSFVGLRGSWDFFRQLSTTTGFTSILVLDENLNQTDDFRADFTNSVAVTMTEGLALKTSLQLLFDNLPSLVAVDLPDGSGVLSVPLKKTDSIFTVAVVANF